MAKPFYVLKRLAAFTILAPALLLSCASFAEQVDLLAYMRKHIEPQSFIGLEPNDIPRYDRSRHFGGWKHQDHSNPCQNTRATVLTRDADPSVPLRYTNSRNCTVARGLWHDSYTGRTVEIAGDIQIDHVVPLKEAYYAGAHAWTSAVRCNYANYISNDFHLRAVDAHENMSKSDKGPEKYLPPNPADQCRYVNAWMKIKAVWRLKTTESEVRAIQDVFRRQGCDDLMRYMNSEELTQQRAKAIQPIASCENRP